MTDVPPRVQFLISGKFIVLLLVASMLLGVGYYWYNRQQLAQQHVAQIREHFKAPPYFVNRGPSVVRSCYQCLRQGKLKPQAEWKVSNPKELLDMERQWFLAVEDPPVPVTIFGVLMLPVFPSLHENPALGFSQSRVELVLFQNLERKFAIEQPPPPPAPAPATLPVPNPELATAPPASPDGKQ